MPSFIQFKLCFNSRSREGATLKWEQGTNRTQVSIHAPVKERLLVFFKDV